jgi:hypothetical protein
MKKFKSFWGVVVAPDLYRAIGKTMEQYVIPFHQGYRDRLVKGRQYSILDLKKTSDSSAVAICYAGNYFVSPRGLGYMFLIEELLNEEQTNS